MTAIIGDSRDHLTSGISRRSLYFWIFLILAANAVSGLIIRAISESGIATAFLTTFGVSAIVWSALVAGLVLIGQSEETDRADPLDIAASSVACALAMLPIANISSVAITLFAAYAIWNSDPGSFVRRGAAIFLAVTANLIWGRLILGLFSRDFLFIDAFFVTNLIGTRQIGNTIQFIGQPGLLVVAPGCSSLQGISLAIVAWVSANQWFGIRATPKSLIWCGLAVLAAVGINIVRLAALIRFPFHFDEIHVGWGAQIASFSTMVAIIAIVLWGGRREIFQ